ncbi:protein of unknown function [Trichlorobacter ammonificans]|uniref:Uncharacterized protein n=1 Tax=Trichlorobacter ammonificans TaxID=2916410 RepID=A0ABM9D5K0_9BACT|nr:protein of unknown function [Trichlorobacter ammonificans]
MSSIQLCDFQPMKGGKAMSEELVVLSEGEETVQGCCKGAQSAKL